MTPAAGKDAAHEASPQFREGKFHNQVEGKRPSGWDMPKLWWRFLFGKNAYTEPPAPLKVRPLTRDQLAQASEGTLYRLGHSTILMKLNNAYWLTDPVFGKRASPFSWMGPKRFHETPIALADLPPLAGVILSHDHYDHLDRETVLTLAARTPLFITPLGVGDLLIEWGVPKEKVRQLDWWQSFETGGIKLTATPAQHFSGRSLLSGNETLWASWVIKSDRYNIFFSGDTGYFAGFKEIGQRLGPFDVTMLEAGAYDAMWEGVHMMPAHTIQAHKDLGGGWLLPIHNSTFALAFHAWDAPMETLTVLATKENVRLTTPMIGQPLQLDKIEPFTPWWREQ